MTRRSGFGATLGEHWPPTVSSRRPSISDEPVGGGGSEPVASASAIASAVASAILISARYISHRVPVSLLPVGRPCASRGSTRSWLADTYPASSHPPSP